MRSVWAVSDTGKGENVDGIIVLDKPFGKTSHDMVAFVRRLTGLRRVGHTGTLDPAATGVLPVCVGKATKAADMLTVSDKRYIAEMALGMITDTQDAEGETLAECAVTCTEEDIRRVVQGFVGQIEQLPPMYSAVKQNGRKLYELAREGKTVERRPRTVVIYAADILAIDLERGTVTLDVLCSKGTYIRTLCEDIGLALGCGAYVNRLRRTASGDFTENDCVTPDALMRMKQEGTLADAVIPVDLLFSELEKITVRDEDKIKNGVRIRCEGICEGQRYRLYNTDGVFLCISAAHDGRLVLEKSFW